MTEIKSCAYNDDTGTIEAEFSDGKKISILINKIEDTLDLTPIMRSKLDWLIFNEPSTLAELFISGELRSFLKEYAVEYNEQERNIRKQLEKQYPPEAAREIAREFMMYES